MLPRSAYSAVEFMYMDGDTRVRQYKNYCKIGTCFGTLCALLSSVALLCMKLMNGEDDASLWPRIIAITISSLLSTVFFTCAVAFCCRARRLQNELPFNLDYQYQYMYDAEHSQLIN